MSTTLAAVFENYPDAQHASTKLQAFGIDKQSIQLNGSSSMSTDTLGSSGTSSSVGRSDDEPGVLSRFFSGIFGSDDDSSASRYSAAADRGHVVLTVSVADESQVDDISEMLNDCGAIDIDEKEQQWKTSGTLAGQTGAALTGNLRQSSDESLVSTGGADTLKRVEENLQVGKRTVQKGSVRVHQRVIETPVEEQVTLREERASIDRKVVDRPATEADLQAAFKDKSIDIQETAEEAVVAKTAKVVEEIQVGKEATARTETVRETLRRTEIDVDNGDTSLTGSGSSNGVGGVMTGTRQVYSGFERRMSNDPKYSGKERRMAA